MGLRWSFGCGVVNSGRTFTGSLSFGSFGCRGGSGGNGGNSGSGGSGGSGGTRRGFAGRPKAAPPYPLEGPPLERLLLLLERDAVIQKKGKLSISRDRSDPEVAWVRELKKTLGGGSIRHDKNAELYQVLAINLRRRVLAAIRDRAVHTPRLRIIREDLARSLEEDLPPLPPLPTGPLGELGDAGPHPRSRSLWLPLGPRRRWRPGFLGSASRLRGSWRERLLAVLDRPQGFYCQATKGGCRMRLALYQEETAAANRLGWLAPEGKMLPEVVLAAKAAATTALAAAEAKAKAQVQAEAAAKAKLKAEAAAASGKPPKVTRNAVVPKEASASAPTPTLASRSPLKLTVSNAVVEKAQTAATLAALPPLLGFGGFRQGGNPGFDGQDRRGLLDLLYGTAPYATSHRAVAVLQTLADYLKVPLPPRRGREPGSSLLRWNRSSSRFRLPIAKELATYRHWGWGSFGLRLPPRLGGRRLARRWWQWLAGLIDGDGSFKLIPGGGVQFAIAGHLKEEPGILKWVKRLLWGFGSLGASASDPTKGGAGYSLTDPIMVRWLLHNCGPWLQGVQKRSDAAAVAERLGTVLPARRRPTAAWALGLFEAEGNLNLKGGGEAFALCFQLTITEQATAKALKALFGGQVYQVLESSRQKTIEERKKEKRSPLKPAWTWSLTADDHRLEGLLAQWAECPFAGVKGGRLPLVAAYLGLKRAEAHLPNSPYHREWQQFYRLWRSYRTAEMDLLPGDPPRLLYPTELHWLGRQLPMPQGRPRRPQQKLSAARRRGGTAPTTLFGPLPTPFVLDSFFSSVAPEAGKNLLFFSKHKHSHTLL